MLLRRSDLPPTVRILCSRDTTLALDFAINDCVMILRILESVSPRSNHIHSLPIERSRLEAYALHHDRKIEHRQFAADEAKRYAVL
jgi:hypothetical protein